MTSRTAERRHLVRMHAQSVGPMAQRALASGSTRPFAHFERCAYVTAANGQIVCIGDSTIGDGPLNAILTPGSAATLLLDPKEPVEYRVDLTDATLWQPDRSSEPMAATRAPATWTALRTAAQTFALEGGLSPLLVPLLEGCAPGAVSNQLLSRAWPGIASLRDWLRHQDDLRMPVPAETLALIGLGPGLTPSGDDVLAGCMVALHHTGRRNQAVALAEDTLTLARRNTNRISVAHLECAAAGYASAALHRTLTALLADATQELPDHLLTLDRVGHSSGWDGLIGVVLGLAVAQ